MKKSWRILPIILAVLLLVVLVGPFLIPIPTAAGTVSPQQLADADSKFVEINGITVHYKMMELAERISFSCTDLAPACSPGTL